MNLPTWFFFKIVWTIPGPLLFHINFATNLSILTWWDYVKSLECFSFLPKWLYMHIHVKSLYICVVFSVYIYIYLCVDIYMYMCTYIYICRFDIFIKYSCFWKSRCRFYYVIYLPVSPKPDSIISRKFIKNNFKVHSITCFHFICKQHLVYMVTKSMIWLPVYL